MRSMFLLGILAIELGAQTPLYRANVFQAGDRYTRRGVVGTEIDPTPAGAGQVWDFRAAALDAAEDGTVAMTDLAGNPHQARFPQANLVEVRTSATGTSSQFYQTSETGLVYLGFAAEQNGTTLVAPYEKSSQILTFPFVADAMQSDTFQAAFSSGGIDFQWSGSVTSTADGSGTLLLPTASYQNTLRVKTVQEIDQAATSSGLANHISTVTYAWFVSGVSYPVFSWIQEIQYTELGTRTTTRAFAVEERRFLPHLVAFSGDFTNRLFLRNNGAVEGTVTLVPYQQNGTAGTAQQFTLQPGVVQTVTHETLGVGTSHLEISGAQGCSVTVGYQARSGGGTAHVNQSRVSKEFLIYPGEWDVLFDGMALVNHGSEPALVTGTMLDANGAALGSPVTFSAALAPNAKVLANISASFGSNRGQILKVVSSQPASAIFLRGSLDGRFLYQNQPVAATGAASRWIPHLSAFGGDFTSSLAIHHTARYSQAEETLSLVPFANGVAGTPITVTLAPGQTRLLTHETLGSSTQLLRGDNASSCVMTVGYRARTGGGTAHLHQTDPLRESLAYLGETELLWDGLALANTDPDAATYTAEVLDPTGTVVFQSNLGTREANQKLLRNLSTMFNGSGLTLRVRADQPSALLLLRGSLDGRFLFPNQSL